MKRSTNNMAKRIGHRKKRQTLANDRPGPGKGWRHARDRLRRLATRIHQQLFRLAEVMASLAVLVHELEQIAQEIDPGSAAGRTRESRSHRSLSTPTSKGSPKGKGGPNPKPRSQE